MEGDKTDKSNLSLEVLHRRIHSDITGGRGVWVQPFTHLTTANWFCLEVCVELVPVRIDADC